MNVVGQDRVFLDTKYSIIHYYFGGRTQTLDEDESAKNNCQEEGTKTSCVLQLPCIDFPKQTKHTLGTTHKVSQKEIRSLLSMNFSLIQRKLNILNIFFGPPSCVGQDK